MEIALVVDSSLDTVVRDEFSSAGIQNVKHHVGRNCGAHHRREQGRVHFHLIPVKLNACSGIPLDRITTNPSSGLGLGLATLYLSQPNTRVILTARTNDPSSILEALPKSYPGTLHGIYNLDSASTTDTITLRSSLLSPEHKLQKIDIVIANAGVGAPFDTILDAPIDALEQFYRVNALAPVRLYQQLWKDLLENSANPKFILSRIEADFGVRWVKTDNGQAYADAVNVPEPPTEVEASVKAIFQLVSEATREGMSGKFIDVMSGNELPW
ncbi:hypothetical protein F66182_11765 [Fusarium sp. NRRL 66182]|nr:hypothetical protein F66182_11765 [Fusarium sp. NRRL 66182]